MTPSELALIFQVEHHEDVPEYEIINIHHRRHKRSADSDQIHQIALDAFGDRFELELNRNLNLVPNQRPLNIFYADKDKEDIHYMASNEQEDRANIGEVFQDERNMAALLLYRHGDDDQYHMDGTIGSDLVVKPAPASVRQFVQGGSDFFSSSPSHWTNEDIHSVDRNITNKYSFEEEEEELPVDYAFLDEDEESDYNDINSVNFRFKKTEKT